MLESLTWLTSEHALCLTHSPPPLACHPHRLYNAPSLMPAFLWGTGSEGPGQERSTRAEGVFTSLHHPVVCRDKAYNCLVFFEGGTPTAYGSSQARGQIRATAASLYLSHNNMGSQPPLQPTPQLMAMPDPRPTVQGQGSNPHTHGY